MRKALARGFLRILGWRIVDNMPAELDRYVVIAAPHTSAMDFFLGILARAAIGRKIGFLAKKSLFKPPLGWMMRWLGGYPVDRSSNKQVVSQVVEMFDGNRPFAIALAPEGTRRKVSRLKTGFYHIARGAGVPIIMARLNYGLRTVEFSAPVFPSKDKEASMQAAWDHFKGVRGYRTGKGII